MKLQFVNYNLQIVIWKVVSYHNTMELIIDTAYQMYRDEQIAELLYRSRRLVTALRGRTSMVTLDVKHLAEQRRVDECWGRVRLAFDASAPTLRDWYTATDDELRSVFRSHGDVTGVIDTIRSVEADVDAILARLHEEDAARASMRAPWCCIM